MLKWATLMRYQTTTGDDDDLEEIVIVDTDDFYVSGVIGYTTDGNRYIGRRFSTAFYDWSDDGALSMDGDVTSGSLSTTLSLTATYATNPFYHRYHNMHQEGRDITRYITIDNLASIEQTSTESYAALSGDYMEVINGLANNDTDTTTRDTSIIIQGTVYLVQVSSVSSLGIPD